MWRSGLRQRVKELLMILPPPSFLPPSPSPTHHLAFFTKKPLLGLANASPCSAVTMSTTTNNLDEIFKQKRVLRSKVRKSLKAIDPSLRSQEDDAIQSLVSEAAWFKSSQRLCAYITCYALREVDTSKLLSQILQNTTKDGSAQNAKKLYVPRVEDKNSHMRMLNISSMDDLIANSMDILEPAPVDQHGNAREDVMLANDPVDLFLLPGLAFDKSGRRLGRGGGYYDTFLRKYQDLARERNWRQPLLVALSYSLQIIDDGAIPVTLNDVPVDFLVSPAGVIPISQAALNRLGLTKTGHVTQFLMQPGLVRVIDGKLLVGFVTTSNVFDSKVLTGGQKFVVPTGLIHFQLKGGEWNALIFTTFNSHSPGSAIVPPTLFESKPSIPDDVLTKAFQVVNDVIDNIKS